MEAGVGQGWRQWVGDQWRILAIDCFGASAPGEVVFKMFGFTPEHVVELALEVLAVLQSHGIEISQNIALKGRQENE